LRKTINFKVFVAKEASDALLCNMYQLLRKHQKLNHFTVKVNTNLTT